MIKPHNSYISVAKFQIDEIFELIKSFKNVNLKIVKKKVELITKVLTSMLKAYD